MASKRGTANIDNLSLQIQKGTEKTFVASWTTSGTKTSGIDSYKYVWQYQTGDKKTNKDGSVIWYEGNSGTTSYTNSTFSPPDNATNVKFKVKIVSKTTKIKKKTKKVITNIKWYEVKQNNVKEAIHKVSVGAGSVVVSYDVSREYPLYATVNVKNTKKQSWLDSYQVVWRFWTGSVWVDGETDQVEPGPGEEDLDSLIFEYSGETDIPSNTKRYECKVTPVSNDPYYVGEAVTGYLENINRRRKVTNVSTGMHYVESGAPTIYALWGLSDMKYVESFDYEWEYYDSSYTYSGSSDGRWVADSSGSVSADQPSGSGERPYTCDYTVPNVQNVTDFRFRVRPASGSGSTYIDEWSDWFEVRYVRDTVSMRNIVVSLSPDTDRTLLVRWGTPNPFRDDISGFEYRAYYRISAGGRYVMDANGTVDIVKGVDDPTLFYNFTYDAKSNATDVYIQMRAVPKEDGAFDSPWSSPVTYAFTIPKKKVATQRVARHDVSSRQIDAVWTMTDTSRVSSYEYKWEYYYKNPTLGDIWTVQTGSTTSLNCNYIVPEDATVVRFSVKPVPEADTAFVGEWSEYTNYTLNIPKVSVSNVSIRKMTDTDRDFIVSWTAPVISSELKEHLAGYEIQHRYFADSVWFPSETITITDPDALNSSPITVNERAETWQVRVRPVDDSSNNAFVGDWTNYVDYNIELLIRTCSGISFATQRESERTVVATWAITDNTEVDSYEWEWRYFIDDIWYPPSSGTSTADTPVATYDAPAVATLVDFRVKPIPKYSTSFKSEWTDRAIYEVPDSYTPEIPSAPTVTIEGFNLTAKLDTYDKKTASVEFELVTETERVAVGIAEVVLNRATFIFTVAAGKIYRVRCRGLAGDTYQSEWSQYSSDVYSLPAPLSAAPELSATTENSVIVTWSAVTGAKSYDIEWTKKKRYFDTSPSQVESQTSHEYTILEVEPETGNEWFFRVRTVNDAGHSDWSEIVSLVLGKLPLAPTTWASATTAIVNRDIYLYWIHNAEDKSKETEAELELIVNGVLETHTIYRDPTSTETTSYYMIAAGTYLSGAVLQWRVRTKGVMPDYGAWSTQRIVKVYSPPTISIELASASNWEWDPFDFNTDDIYEADGERTPLINNTMTRFPLLVYLSSSPSVQTPIAYTLSITSNNYYETDDEVGNVRIVNIGQSVFEKYYSTNKHEFVAMIDAGDVDLEHLMNYTITATVVMDSGLSASASMIFRVEWDEDDEVTIDATITYDEDRYTTYIMPECDLEDGSIAPNVTLGVYRREFDGGFVRLASGLSNTYRVTVTDPHPPLDYARYRVVARSLISGRTFYSDLEPEEIGVSSVIIQWDENWDNFYSSSDDDFVEPPWTGSMVILPYNIDVSESNSIDVELVNYIGRKHPVSYYGTHVGQGGTWKTDIPADDKETLYALRRLAVWMGDAYVREPSGIGYWAQVEVSMDQQHLAMVIPVTIKVTRVEGGI